MMGFKKAALCFGVIFAFSVIYIASIASVHARNVQANYPIGELIAAQGDVFYVGQNGKRKVREGDPVFMNTKVETGEDARALLLFIDDTEITLGEDANLTIDEYVFDPYDPEENKGRFSVLKGAFLWTSGMISKRDEPDVGITTSVGSIGIRGTQFWGGQLKDQYGVYVFDGLVNFAVKGGNVDIEPGKGAFYGDNNAEMEPYSWEQNIINNAIKTVKFSNPGNISRRLFNAKEKNYAKRHDYRSQMFPYKENPLRPRLKGEEDQFFSDEFEEMRNRN